MRTLQTLNYISVDAATGIIHFYDTGENSRFVLRREGDYIAISASHGPIEIALRPRFQELERALRTMQPVAGLQTTRQIGTAEAFLSLGLRTDGALNLRPTLVADASGYLCLNLELTANARQKLFEWLGIASS
jgi:hypothetical protein